jgi:hypothetical protein
MYIPCLDAKYKYRGVASFFSGVHPEFTEMSAGLFGDV